MRMVCRHMPPAPGAAPEAGQLAPCLAAVGRLEDGGVLDAGIHRVGVVRRWLEVPDALELVGMGRTVVPNMRTDFAFIGELIAYRFPGLAAVARALHHLAEPAAGLRRVEAVGVGWRPFEVVDLPARKVGAFDLPSFPARVRARDERAFPRSDQYTYLAHRLSPPFAFC